MPPLRDFIAAFRLSLQLVLSPREFPLHAEPAGLPSFVPAPVSASRRTRWTTKFCSRACSRFELDPLATKFQVHSFAQHAQVVCHVEHFEVQVFLFPLEFKPVAMTFVSPHEVRFEGGQLSHIPGQRQVQVSHCSQPAQAQLIN